MRASAMLAFDPQDSDPGPFFQIAGLQHIPSGIVSVPGKAFPSMTVVAFQTKQIQHQYEARVQIYPYRRFFLFFPRKDIATMKIYRYHSGDVITSAEREEELGRQTSLLPLSSYFRRSFLSLLIPDYITCRVSEKIVRGWKEKTVSLLAARRLLHRLLIRILIRRENVPGGHDTTSLDILTWLSWLRSGRTQSILCF